MKFLMDYFEKVEKLILRYTEHKFYPLEVSYEISIFYTKAFREKFL